MSTPICVRSGLFTFLFRELLNFYTAVYDLCFTEMTSSLLKKSVEDQAIDRILSEIAQIIFKCNFCDFITDEKLLMITHYRSTHVKTIEPIPNERSSEQPSELQERFVCSLCFSIFSSREQVKMHMITDHGCIPMVNETSTEAITQRSIEVDYVNGKRDTDKEVHRPISLRELQLKLKSSFVLKYEMSYTNQNRMCHQVLFML